MSLNEDLLPEEPLTEKGVFFYPGNMRTGFGLIHTVSLSQNSDPTLFRGDDFSKEWLDVNLPDVYAQLKKQQTPERANDVRTGWYSDDYSKAFFVMYCLVAEHGLKLPVVGDSVYANDAVSLLLSSILQTGEKPTHRNWQSHLRSRRAKYLPLTIGKDKLYFHVYIPTAERIELARDKFKRVIETIDPLMQDLPELFTLVYSAVRLSEVAESAASVHTALGDVLEQISQIVAPYKKKLGFVYQDMPGSQDVRPFYYEILAKRED